jgi:hypothetical protein
MGAPLGLIGAALDATPIPLFSVNAGLGRNSDGWQLASMARVRTTTDRVAAGFGAGISVGRHTWNNGVCAFPMPCNPIGVLPDVKRTWERAVWGNAELLLEGRADSGFQWRVSGGVGWLLNPNASQCTVYPASADPVPDCKGSGGTKYPYLGFALGYSFFPG